MTSIVLVGPRGSGKTTVGKKLSLMLDFPFVDTDAEFIQQYGAISDFVDKHCWKEFRRLETELITCICQKYQHAKIVFVPGGGAVAHNQCNQYRQKNVELLSGFGFIVYLLPYQDLRQSAFVLSHRVEKDTTSTYSRPSLTETSGL